jgi:cytochrome c peroxidase
MTRAWIAMACVLVASACDRLSGTPFRWQLPPGFPEPVVPADNPMTVEKVALGRRLFFDARLSANGTQSCASCHLPALAFAESVATATGSTGQRHRRNSMSLTNVAYNATFTWAHSGITTLEQHMLLPLFGDQPVEMGAAGHEQEILTRLRADAEYRQLFSAAFPWRRDRINFDHVVKSLASFTRTLISFNSPFDRYAFYGDDAALTEAQIRGMNLFMSERLECAHCHNGFNFSQFVTHESATVQDRAFHITGLNYSSEQPMPGFDYGLYHVTADPADKDKFKAPTLRNIEVTAPYMHDGSLESLSDVIDFYSAGGRGEGQRHPGKSLFIRGFVLDPQEQEDLLAFLSSLTDKEFLTNPIFVNESSHE